MYKNYKEHYVYPAILEYHAATKSYGVRFPDLPGCIALGKSPEEALDLVKEGAALHLWGMEHDQENIPQPTPLKKLSPADKETICLVDINMFNIRAEMDQRAVKKTLTIPWYLNELAEKKKINFSQLLQSALKQKLGLL